MDSPNDLTRRSALKAALGLPVLQVLGPPEPTGHPRPICTMICGDEARGAMVSTLTRLWKPGDTRRCRLCPECSASHKHNVCAIMIVNEDLKALWKTDPDAVRFYRWPEECWPAEGGAR